MVITESLEGSREIGIKLNPLIIVSLWYTPVNICCVSFHSLKKKKKQKEKKSFSPPYLPVPLSRLPFKIILMATFMPANNMFKPIFLDQSTSKKIYFCPL